MRASSVLRFTTTHEPDEKTFYYIVGQLGKGGVDSLNSLNRRVEVPRLRVFETRTG